MHIADKVPKGSGTKSFQDLRSSKLLGITHEFIPLFGSFAEICNQKSWDLVGALRIRVLEIERPWLGSGHQDVRSLEGWSNKKYQKQTNGCSMFQFSIFPYFPGFSSSPFPKLLFHNPAGVLREQLNRCLSEDAAAAYEARLSQKENQGEPVI